VPLGRMPCPPLLVVTSRIADDRLWSEVLNLGGYNVLAKPLNMKEVFHVVGLAWMLLEAALGTARRPCHERLAWRGHSWLPRWHSCHRRALARMAASLIISP
jgi:hypothetical protein